MSDGPFASLREIHRLRRFIKGLREEIERAPRLRLLQQSKVSRQEELFHQAQEGIKQLKVVTREKEAALKTTHSQIAKHQKQLNEVTSKKEFDALQSEIAADREKCGELEDEILDYLAKTEDEAARLPELESTVQRIKQEFIHFEGTSKERLAGLGEQLQKANVDLKQVESTLVLPHDVRERYERVVAAKGEDAFGKVEGRTCTACNTGITAQQFNDLANAQFVFCRACERILYLADELAAAAEED
jgi:predicted  nucleic acid-binding Zn-ribbon protein